MPHQRRTCSGLRHRLEHELPRRVEQTRQRISRSDGRGDLEGLAICDAADDHVFFSFALQFLQVGLEPVEALLPDVAVALGPLGDFLERRRLDPARPPLRLAPARDQAGALEHPQVLRDGRHAHVERLGELGDRALARGQPRQDRPAGRVGEGGKRGAELIDWHAVLNHPVN